MDGDDVWPEVLEAYLATLRGEEEPEWDPALIEALGMIPNYYPVLLPYRGTSWCGPGDLASVPGRGGRGH